MVICRLRLSFEWFEQSPIFQHEFTISLFYKLDYTCTSAGQGGPKGFCAGVPQMCDVTDVRSKVPTDWSKSSSPQDVHFLTHFYFHRNQITLSICGDTSFLPSFLRSIVLFKAISYISGSKKWSKRSVTHARTDAETHGQTHIKNLRPPAQKPFGQ